MYVYIALFVLAFIYVGTLFFNSAKYENRIYPGVKVAGVDLGGETRAEAAKSLSKKIKGLPDNIVLSGQNQYKYSQDSLGVSYDIQKSADNAFQIGRNNSLNPIKEYHENIPAVVKVDQDKLTGALFNATQKENQEVDEAGISMQDGKIKVQKEHLGRRVLLGENIEMIENGLGRFQNQFSLKVAVIKPSVTEDDINLVRNQIQDALTRKISLKGDGVDYTLSDDDITGFMGFKTESGESLAYKTNFSQIFSSLDQMVRLAFRDDAINSWVISFSNNINKSPQNAKLAMDGDKLMVVVPSVNGEKVEVDDLVGDIRQALEGGDNNIDIPTVVTRPDVTGDNLDKLGIKELVSTGWTDFSGSPSNRIHNIDVGAARFNGVLIKPGEDFSFDDTLGNVDASTGYLPELVILKDKTVPEYGGGLCQVSTTAFRAALNAGLPILERAAHAYPVGYYKPYGVDATIYLPSPDLIFKNDTPGYILIQTRILDNKLYFDFYGTKKPGSIKFAGNADGTQGVSPTVEGITPTITEQDVRGPKSFTATFYRFIYDTAGNLIKKNFWVSKYDSPDKYPH